MQHDLDSSSASRSSRSSTPSSPATSSDELSRLSVEPFKYFNEAAKRLSNPPSSTKPDVDFNAWMNLGDDFLKQEDDGPDLLLSESMRNGLFESNPLSLQRSGLDIFSPQDFPHSSSNIVPESTSVDYPQLIPSLSSYPIPQVPTQPAPPPTVTPSSSGVRSMEADTRTVYPSRASCNNLPIHFPNLPSTGAKSRVETQIRVVIDLAAHSSPHSTQVTSAPSRYDRVGSWKYLRLPPGSATRRRPRKEPKIDAKPEDTLYLSTQVHCASAPYLNVTACSSCQNREAKRVARKIAARVRPSRSDEEESSPFPAAIVRQPEGSQDQNGIVLFNCSDTLEFGDGSAPLPVRITCYCRHHRERVGFNVTVSLRDCRGRLVAVGTTPPIMITDDHKTTCKTTNSTDAEAEVSVISSQRGGSAEAKAVRKRKGKPYDGGRPSKSAKPSPTSPTTQGPALYLPSPVATSDSNAPSPSASSSDILPLIDGVLHDDFPLPRINPEPFSSGLDQVQLPTAPPSPIMPPVSFYAPMFGIYPGPATRSNYPTIHRLIPAAGSTQGGVEITILGSDFSADLNLNVMFGDLRSSLTQRWSDNTLVCLLPASPAPGVVAVTFDGLKDETALPVIFTYVDESDRALMELALQVVGMKMTGKVENAKDVAMRIVANESGEGISSSVDASELMQVSYGVGCSKDLESLLLKFLSLLDTNYSAHSSRHALALRSRSQQSLLHLAVHRRFSSLVKYLVQSDIDIDARDRNGFTALHFAAIGCWQGGIEILLRSGADLEVVDALGRSPEECDSLGSLEFSIPCMRSGISSASVTSDEGEADNEDEGDLVTSYSRPPSRKSSRTSLRRLSGSSTPLRSLDSVLPTYRGDDQKGARASANDVPSDTKTDPALANQNFLMWLRDSLAALQAGNAPAVPWPLLQFNQFPQLTNLPMPPLPQLPQMQALTQMPMVFPIYVPTPWWPTLQWPQTFSNDPKGKSKCKGGDGEAEVKTNQDLISEWKGALEKWIALAAQTLPQRSAPEEPPPQYSAAIEKDVEEKPADPSTSQSTSLAPLRTQPLEQVSSHVKEKRTTFGYRQTHKTPSKKDDRMLFWFWIPSLLLGLLWAMMTSFPFALGVLRDRLPLQDYLRF